MPNDITIYHDRLMITPVTGKRPRGGGSRILWAPNSKVNRMQTDISVGDVDYISLGMLRFHMFQPIS